MMAIVSDESRMKVHLIIEYIRQFSFCFEEAEVIENPYEVLEYFGIFEELNFDEEALLLEELLKLAERFEVKEAIVWAECNRLSSV